jgi:hypothetical protein
VFCVTENDIGQIALALKAGASDYNDKALRPPPAGGEVHASGAAQGELNRGLTGEG